MLLSSAQIYAIYADSFHLRMAPLSLVYFYATEKVPTVACQKQRDLKIFCRIKYTCTFVLEIGPPNRSRTQLSEPCGPCLRSP